MSEQRVPRIVSDLADDLGAEVVDVVGPLPDGSGFATLSLPLPGDHWLYDAANDVLDPPSPWRIGTGPERDKQAEQVREAARWAIRGATMRGSAMDFDPDAMVQNFIVGLLGYWSEDGR